MFGVSKEIWKGYSFREKLYVICKKMGILKFAQFVNRKVLGNAPKQLVEERNLKQSFKPQTLDRECIFHQEFKKFIADIKNLDIPNVRQNILFSGYLSSYRKGGNVFLKKVLEEMPGVDIIAMSQSGKGLTQRERNQIEFDMLLTVPRVPFHGGYDKNLNIHLTEEMRKTIEERVFLQEAIENIKSYHDDMGEGYADALAYYTYLYTKAYVLHCKPQCVIVHNKLYPMHDIIAKTCEEYGVKALYFEFGALPGTFALEDKGQMGASHVATNYEEFKKLPVTDSEIEYAKSVCQFLKESGLNRNQQIERDNTEFWNKLKKDRPIVLYAGQNDYDSGICPYTEYSKKFHSPIFENSDQAAMYLAELAKKHDWNLIYKPHPLPVKHGRCLGNNLPENVIWISDIDINEIIDEADVVVTILSQVGDVALIREKAVVMLGYTQLRGKGCAYEAYEKEEIEQVLLEAVENGYTEKQKESFIRHVAQVNKYYLYDDLNDRTVRFGRSVTECAEYIGQVTADVNKKKEYIGVYCNNLKEIVFAIQLKVQNNFTDNVSLLLEKGQLNYLNLEKLNEYFENIVCVEDLQDISIDYLFVSDIQRAKHIVSKCIKNNSKLEIYLYDSLATEQYFKDLKNSSDDTMKYVHGKFTWNKSLEVWKNSKFQYFEMKPFDITDLTNIIPTSDVHVEEKYIYVESKEFAQKVVTNEMDILEQFSQIVGKENILVKLNSPKSEVRFKMRGYKIGFENEIDWEMFQISKEIENKVIVGLYPSAFISPRVCTNDLKCTEIYLYPLLVGNVKFLSSNTFLRFMPKYREMLAMKENAMYVIEKSEQLETVLNYIGE